jgi:hypothetical protein
MACWWWNEAQGRLSLGFGPLQSLLPAGFRQIDITQSSGIFFFSFAEIPVEQERLEDFSSLRARNVFF